MWKNGDSCVERLKHITCKERKIEKVLRNDMT